MGTAIKKTKTAHLKLLSGERDEPARIELTGTKVEIGRAVSNDIMINSAHVSRKHVVFMYDKNTWMVKDLSTNGVSINSRKLPKDQFVPLSNADKISLVPTGALQYQFQYVAPTTVSEQRKSGTVEAPSNRSVSWGVQSNEENIPAPTLLGRINGSSTKPDCKSAEYKNVWKRPHNNVEYGSSSDSDEPKNSKKLRVKNEMDCSDTSDSESDDGLRKSMKSYFTTISRLSPIININQTPSQSSNVDPIANGKDDGSNDSLKSDTKRRNDEQISSLKRKVLKLEGDNALLSTTCQKLEIEKKAMLVDVQKEKLDVYDSIMDSFGTEFGCSICTEVFIDPTVINCGHTFCSFCINQWLKEKTVCAICRKPVTSQSRHVEINNLLVSIWSKMPQTIQYKRQNDVRDREEAVKTAQARARAEANRPRPTATLGRGTAFIPEENFVSFLLSRHFFAQVVDRERPVTVSLRAGRLLNSRSSPSSPQRSASPRRPVTPPRPATPPRRRSARIQVRSQIN